MVYVWAVILLLANGVAWLSNVFTLPGNWVLVAFSLLYAVFLPEDWSPRISLTMVVTIFVLAVLGEIVEFLAGAVGAARHGGNKMGVALAVVGAFVGSIIGAIVLAWLPIIGTIIGALGGGAAGAFLGAWAGELGGHRTHTERYNIGRGAAIGRLLGAAGKTAIGAIMLVLVTFDSFYDFRRHEPEIVPNSPHEVNEVSRGELPARDLYAFRQAKLGIVRSMTVGIGSVDLREEHFGNAEARRLRRNSLSLRSPRLRVSNTLDPTVISRTILWLGPPRSRRGIICVYQC